MLISDDTIPTNNVWITLNYTNSFLEYEESDSTSQVGVTAIDCCDDTASHRRTELHSSVISTSSITNSATNDSKSKHVRFPTTNQAVQIMDTIHCNDYSAEESASTWYTTTDMKAFKRERKQIARLVDQGISEEEILLVTGSAVRGIEPVTQDGYRKRRQYIIEGIQSVLDEQHMQYEDGKWSPGSIAYIYHNATDASVRDAYQRANEDAKVVQDQLEYVNLS